MVMKAPKEPTQTEALWPHNFSSSATILSAASLSVAAYSAAALSLAALSAAILSATLLSAAAMGMHGATASRAISLIIRAWSSESKLPC